MKSFSCFKAILSVAPLNSKSDSEETPYHLKQKTLTEEDEEEEEEEEENTLWK